eukprot:scaffold156841_cov38-Prasinocladus_malaysianus.AAC.1
MASGTVLVRGSTRSDYRLRVALATTVHEATEHALLCVYRYLLLSSAISCYSYLMITVSEYPASMINWACVPVCPYGVATRSTRTRTSMKVEH